MIKSTSTITAFLLGIILGPAALGAAPTNLSQVRTAAAAERPTVRYSRIPLYFEANRGQAPAGVRYISRGQGYALYLTKKGPFLALRRESPRPGPARGEGKRPAAARSAVIGMTLVGANQGVAIGGRQRQAGVVNYLVGKDARRWHRAIPTYRRVAYSGVYPGIDLVYHGRQNQLEYDFDVAPGADPKRIELSFSGIDGMRVDSAGRLHLRAGGGEVIEKAPIAYQRIDGVRRPVASRYVLTGPRQVSFAVSGYDPRRALVIDPVLSFSSYLGGSQNDRALAIARDPANDGVVFITGRTASGTPAAGGSGRSFLDAIGALNNSAVHVDDPTCGGLFSNCADVRLSYTFFNSKYGADPGATANLTSDATLYPAMWSDSGNVVRNDRLMLITGTAKDDQASVTAKAALSGDFDTRVSLSQLDQPDKFTAMEVQIGGETFDWGVASTAAAQQFELVAGGGGANCSSSAPALTTDVTTTPFTQAQDVRVVRSQGTLNFYFRAPGTSSFTLGGTCTNAPTSEATFKLFVVTRQDAATQTTTAKTSVFRDFHLTSSTTAAQSTATIRMTQSLAGDFDGHATVGNIGVAGRQSGVEVDLQGAGTFDWYIANAGGTPTFELDTSTGASCSKASSLVSLAGVSAQDLEVVRRKGTLTFYYRTPGTIQFTLGGTCTNVPSGTGSTAVFKLYVKSTDGTSKTAAFDDFHAEQSNGGPDAFVMRLDNGQLKYATYLGGSGEDEGRAIRADGAGDAFVAGRTDSGDFPVTDGTTCPDTNGDSVCDNGGDAFVAAFGPSGTLTFGTYFGGCFDDGANGVDIDSAGNIYIAGYTSSASTATPISGASTCVSGFPAQGAGGQPALQTSNHGRTDAFVAKYLAPSGGGSAYTLGYATYLGGTHSDEALGIAVVPATGDAFVTGDTGSSDFPLANPVPCPQCDSTHYHAFVSEIDTNGSTLLNSTLLGGSAYDYGSAIAVHQRTDNSTVDAYVTGWTRSDDFPVRPVATHANPQGPVQAAHHGSYDVFFSKLNFSKADPLVYSTYLGTTDIEAGQGIAITGCNDDCSVWITGYTMAPDFLVALLRDAVPSLDAPLDFLQDYQSVDSPSSDTPESAAPSQTLDTDDPHNDQPNLNSYVLDNLSVDALASALNQMDSSLNLTTLESLSRSALIGKIFQVVNGYVETNLHPLQLSRRGVVDGFVVNLVPGGGGYNLNEATYLGGRHENYATGITLDGSGNPYVVGYTQAADFPVTGDALQSEYCPSDNSDNACGEDGFVAKIVKGDVDLSVAMTSDAPPGNAVDPGTNVTFTMTVKNNSAQSVSGVQLVDNIPIGLQLVKAVPADRCTPSQFDIASFNHTVTCSLGTLAGGASTVVTVTVMTTAETESPTQNPGTTLPTGPPPQVNSASVTGFATDNKPDNNRASSDPIFVKRTFIPPENTPHPVLSQKFPTFQGIDPPGGGGGLGLLSLVALAAGAGWQRRSAFRRRVIENTC